MSLEHLFATSVLSLSVPNSSVEFPPSYSADDWLDTLASNSQERKQAFFDEQLQSLLTLRVEHPTPVDPVDPSLPPAALITFLAHVQVSLEASYISSVPTSVETPQAHRLSAPPRTASLGVKSSARGGAHHPSILPPNTPNPTPATADHDRKYVASQGALLFTSIWGQNTVEDSNEEFALVWSEREKVWVAVYRLALTVSFLRLNFRDPLLCLTISATLREKPVTTSSTQHPFIRFLKSFDGVVIPESPAIVDKAQTRDDDDNLDGFEEVNLLEGLLAGPTFSRMASGINLPSTRLGTVSRQKLFSLPPVNLLTPTVPSPSPASATRGKVHPTLRKSYRKTLETASGFRVRMRTVFVPSVVLDASREEQDKMTSGNEERTVVLCVEIENSGESGQGIGFEVEKVDVAISGDEAKATLITWGHESFTAQDNVFPLQIAQWAQYNLLYAVTFLRSPEELNAFSFARQTINTTQSDLQRAVSINIHGRPYMKSSDSSAIIYPTRTFSSKWNCVLDLSSPQSQTNRHPLDPSDPSTAHPSVLPEPPSPFPVFGLQTSKLSPGATHFSSTTATLTSDPTKGQLAAGRVIKSSTPRLSAVPMSANPSPMSLPAQGQFSRSPTTYSAPPPPHHPQLPPDLHHPHERPHSGLGLPPSRTHTPPIFDSPQTPAYPAFPPPSNRSSGVGMVPPTPTSHTPIMSSQMNVGVVGPSLGARRNRGSGVGPGVEPPTPVPSAYSHQQQQQESEVFGNEQQRTFAGAALEGGLDNGGDTVVVSVGLLDVVKSGGVGAKARARAKRRLRKLLEHDDDETQDEDEDEEDEGGEGEEDEEKGDSSEKSYDGLELGPGKIYPLDVFTLDIFVFNKSERTRRFEISYFERRRRRRGPGGADAVASEAHGGATKKMGYPGIIPMEGRVRIGPLLSSACQSVRMEFLAVSPGVHSIEALTLTDIESGFSVNLRSVMDIVVHSPDG